MNMKNRFTTISEYIEIFPEDVRKILNKIRATIQKAAPKAEETISYQIPTFRLNGNLVHFAAYKNHIGFYPTSSVILKFKKELSAYKTSRGTVQFPLNQPVPYRLISQIVKFRMKENSEKAKRKKKNL